jgi:hypothetical protein
MISSRTHGRAALAVVAAVCFAIPVSGAVPARLSGAISGFVTNTTGVPQMGATVLLFDRFERLQEKALTDERGFFSFASLLPDIYSIRVTLASFVPAVKGNIVVQPGMRSLLNVSLANLFSSIQFVYPTGGDSRALMSDDWKWVLRTAQETRPVLRFLPGFGSDPQRRTASIFSDTRGVVRVSSGDAGGFASSPVGEADLGTAFALATSVYGKNEVGVAGRLGSGAQTGMPSAAFRTSFSRSAGLGTPEVAVTMRQLFLPRLGSDAAMPALRSMTLDFDDQTQLSDTVTVGYGFSLDSVSFLDRLNYFSPYARISYAPDTETTVEFTYTSGNARPDLGGYSRRGAELQRDLITLAMFPRVSLRDGQARVQRGENYEVSISRVAGSRVYHLRAYREAVTNAALTVDAPEGLYADGDILPDPYSGNAVFNAGNYDSFGYAAAVTQNFGDDFSATLMLSSSGALTAEPTEAVSESPDQLRAMIRAGRRNAATLRASGLVPWTGTRMAASYQWADHRAVSPGHLYSTQTMRPEPGLNLYMRQPVPWSPFALRMEVTGDLRNLLAQGYLPLNVPGGRRIYLMQTPRAFRGGLNFIF